MVALEITAARRMDTTIACAATTQLLIASSHAIHIGRRASKVSQHSIESFGRSHQSHLVEDRLLASRHHLFTLMGGDGAERASAKTASMDIHRVLDHLESWHCSAFFIFWMWHSHIRQVETVIQLFACHRWFRRIDDDGERGIVNCEL